MAFIALITDERKGQPLESFINTDNIVSITPCKTSKSLVFQSHSINMTNGDSFIVDFDVALKIATYGSKQQPLRLDELAQAIRK